VNGLAGLAPFVLIAVVFWLLLIRPQRRRQLELMATQRGVEVGDEVILGAGIVGRVSEADDEYLRLEVDPGVHLKVARQSVVRVLHPEPETPTDDASVTDPTGTGATRTDKTGTGATGTDRTAEPFSEPAADPTERSGDH
jgi:preprotein translocase subunit YajC